MTVILATTAYESEHGAELRQKLEAGHSFWEVVAPQFKKRDLTRADVLEVLTWALDATEGNLLNALQLLNIPDTDRNCAALYRFLYRHELVLRLPN